MRHVRTFESFHSGKHDDILDLIVHTVPYTVELGRNRTSDVPVLALDIPSVWKGSGKEVSITEGYEFFKQMEKDFGTDVLELQSVKYMYYNLKDLFSKHVKHFAPEMKKIPSEMQKSGLMVDKIYGAVGYELNNDEASYDMSNTMTVCILLKEDEELMQQYRGHISTKKFGI